MSIIWRKERGTTKVEHAARIKLIAARINSFLYGFRKGNSDFKEFNPGVFFAEVIVDAFTKN